LGHFAADRPIWPYLDAGNFVKVTDTGIEGLKVITPDRHVDGRGFFSESWNKSRLEKAGIRADFVQDNHSLSHQMGTIRGLHFQAPPHAQAKLVRCGRGRFFDVAVDVRKGSATFGKWAGVELSFENGRQLFIPAGFLHGFVTREPDTEVIYKCSNHYAPDCDGTVQFDDPDIGIDWGMEPSRAILSEKDANAISMRDFSSPFTYEGVGA